MKEAGGLPHNQVQRKQQLGSRIPDVGLHKLFQVYLKLEGVNLPYDGRLTRVDLFSTGVAQESTRSYYIRISPV